MAAKATKATEKTEEVAAEATTTATAEVATEATTTATAEVATEATTVKIKVIKSFRDKNDKKIRFEVGAELEFDVDRAKDVVDRGLAEYVEPVA